MKQLFSLLLLIISSFSVKATDTTFFKADHPDIQYTGRIDMSNPAAPRFWQPGVYIRVKFKGSYCKIIIDDAGQHNYLAIQVDDLPVKRLKVLNTHNIIDAADHLNEGEHILSICKNTEAGIGYLQFLGVKCRAILPLPAKPVRKMEFIGNSITCGSGSDVSVIPCGQGQWFDQHNAYMSYGPLTARAFNAQWQLSSVSGIGLIHSCCGMPFTMPQMYDKINMRDDSLTWNFEKYQPNVVTVCLGENDGKQDSVTFCHAYLQFLHTLRTHYPKATIICTSSPMADAEFRIVLQNYLQGIVNASKDKNIFLYFISKKYGRGCGEHPDLAEHQLIANELISYIKKLKKWD